MTRDDQPRPRIRPQWWPDDEQWPPREWRYGSRRHGPWGDGSRHGWSGPRRPFGCLFIVVPLLVAGLLTSAVWALAALVGLVSAPSIVVVGGVIVTVLFLVASSVAFAAMSRMSAPIDDLSDAAERIERGDYSARVAERGPRQVRSLVRAFNEMSARLADVDSGRRTFLADVAHELRTPLAVIEGQLEAIEDGVYPADAAHLAPIREQIRTLEQLIDDLRTVALAESGSLTLERAPTELGALVDDVVAAYSAQARATDVSIVADNEPGQPAAFADPARIRQLLGNLLTNSLRHTPAGGSVTVRTRASTDRATLAVEVVDNGSGIPRELLPRVFDRFVKGEGSKGSGLGLAICRDIIRAHDGDISIASRPDRGTTVTFTLPAVKSGG